MACFRSCSYGVQLPEDSGSPVHGPVGVFLIACLSRLFHAAVPEVPRTGDGGWYIALRLTGSKTMVLDLASITTA